MNPVRILMLTSVLPTHRRGGGELVSQLFVDVLREAGASVTVLGYQRAGDRPAAASGAIAAGQRPIESRSATLAAVGWAARALGTHQPYSSVKFRSRAFRARAVQLHARGADVVVIDHAQMGWIADIAAPPTRLVLLAHNVERELYAWLAATSGRRAARILYRRESRLMGDAEQRLAERATQTWTLSAGDARALGGRSFSFPATVPPIDPGAPRARRRDVGLLGTWTWRANRAALEWFAACVLPLLPRDLTIHVAGRGGDWLPRDHPGLTVLGVVEDAGRFLRESAVLAIPAVGGGGVQIKTLDAIASGTPVVVSSPALRGITSAPASVRRIDDPAAFAAELTRIAAGPPSDDAGVAAIAWSLERERRFRREVAQALADLRR
jgi:hypothetical protein